MRLAVRIKSWMQPMRLWITGLQPPSWLNCLPCRRYPQLRKEMLNEPIPHFVDRHRVMEHASYRSIAIFDWPLINANANPLGFGCADPRESV
jgi:hypothetical protein